MPSTDSSILPICMKNHRLVHPRLDYSRKGSVWFGNVSVELQNGAPRPWESYTLLKAANKLRLVTGWPLILIWNPWVSSPTFHLTPRALSSIKTPITRSSPLTPSFLSLSWIVFRTSKLLLEKFIRLKLVSAFFYQNFISH